jgi:hypothetical protein
VPEKPTIVLTASTPEELEQLNRDLLARREKLAAGGGTEDSAVLAQIYAEPMSNGEAQALAEGWKSRANVRVKPQPLTRPQRTYLATRGLLTVARPVPTLARRIRGALKARRRTGRRPTLALASHGPPGRPEDKPRPRPSRLARLLALLRRRP